MAEYKLLHNVPAFDQFKELSQQDIMDTIMKPPNKSCCLDPIPTELLKKCIDILIKPITAIVNKSLSTGSFQDCWKCALVIPLLKKVGLDLISKNYRPVRVRIIEAAEQLVHSFVLSTIDYCNSLMYRCTKNLLNKLQKIQNCAARVVTGAKRFDHVKPILESLHWLPVSSRIEFKIALHTYKCLNGLAP